MRGTDIFWQKSETRDYFAMDLSYFFHWNLPPLFLLAVRLDSYTKMKRSFLLTDDLFSFANSLSLVAYPIRAVIRTGPFATGVPDGH